MGRKMYRNFQVLLRGKWMDHVEILTQLSEQKWFTTCKAAAQAKLTYTPDNRATWFCKQRKMRSSIKTLPPQNGEISFSATKKVLHVPAVKVDDKIWSKRKGKQSIADRIAKLKEAAAAGRRRMAQREFSDRCDSPVMVRLLQEIIDAQDD